MKIMHKVTITFQPTLPARGATASRQQKRQQPAISTHAPRTGSDGSTPQASRRRRFQPTLPARGATQSRQPEPPAASNFNPRSPHGERLPAAKPNSFAAAFQPTLPARGATTGARIRPRFSATFQPTLPARGATNLHSVFQKGTIISTHAPRTGSDLANVCSDGARLISTHAPRTGSDPHLRGQAGARPLHFNPRSPHGERPTSRRTTPRAKRTFQPTLPARGATSTRRRGACASAHFNPRSPHGERHDLVEWANEYGHISTHAPRTGSDFSYAPSGGLRIYFNPRSPHGERRASCWIPVTPSTNFNPRSPHGERRLLRLLAVCWRVISTHAPRTGSDDSLYNHILASHRISTHAPRTGSDRRRPAATRPRRRFQPTLPARGATLTLGAAGTRNAFQPTLPARGATAASATLAESYAVFQPTLPARGATLFCDFATYQITHFNPRSPHGERPKRFRPYHQDKQFQPTLPARGATGKSNLFNTRDKKFQPTLPARGATITGINVMGGKVFQPTLPARGATVTLSIRLFIVFYFNPRSPHGERRRR